ncbi:hypothetical protein DY000_02060731 [Brassica cretica]|uniref:Uncharacterized protein n=1 Tax=Brassica cretica TaxID=69181 RepID=A0ABQ7B3J8_BRACR|nr:hypothetical protein DY000_02060731 [Brassica cretica]
MSLRDVTLKSTLTERRLGVAVVTSLPVRQTRATSGCRCGDVAPSSTNPSDLGMSLW